MPCSITDNTITPPPVPAGTNLGSGFAPSIPALPFDFEEVSLESLSEIFNALSMALPGGGTLKPGLSESFSKNIADGVLSILEKFMPFLYFYSFFMPLLNIILCIIEVLCAIPNPFKLIRALRRLFRKCLPDFLSLFPAFALIAMIISLLIVILTLIQYLIAQLAKTINALLINIRVLSKAASRLDNDSILSITKKIGYLLCYLQNLFVILGFIGLIIDVIKSVLRLSFRVPPCDSSGGSDDDCCTPDVCPSFIKNNEEIIRVTGSFRYLNQAGIDSGSIFPSFFPKLVQITRQESWQFYDAESPEGQQIINISNPFDLNDANNKVFFPQGIIYTDSSDYRNVPYTFDMRLFYDPAFWGRTGEDARFVRIKNCIVSQAPYDGYYNYNNVLVPSTNGTAIPVAGLVYEDDGITPITLNGTQYNLRTFLHLDPTLSSVAAPVLNTTDGYAWNDVEYTFKINHEVLLDHSLITLGCVPSVAFDRDFINTTFSQNVQTNGALLADIVNNNDSSGTSTFPDMNEVNACINTALAKLRLNITESTLAEFESEVKSCLNNLQSNISGTLTKIINVGADTSKSTFEINPSVQFTTRRIIVKVFLNDSNGISISSNLPADVALDMASKIEAITTVGSVASFVYDGTSSFVGEIESSQGGDGTIKIVYNNKTFVTVTNPDSIDTSPSISDQSKTYKFIVSSANNSEQGNRRDEGDVSRGSSISNRG